MVQGVAEEVDLPLIMPISAFLVLVGINSNLDNMVVYKQWKSVKTSMNNTEGLHEHSNTLTAFIAVILISHKYGALIKLKQSNFVHSPSATTLQWKRNQMVIFFPAATHHTQHSATDNTTALVDNIA